MPRQFVKRNAGEERRDRIGEEQRLSRIFSTVYLALLIVFLGVSVYLLFFSPLMKVEKIRIIGAQALSDKDITSDAEGIMDTRRFGILSGRNYIFLPTGEIESVLRQKYKRIRGVEIKRRFPDSLEIRIEERQAIFVWCSNGGCFLVDEEGIPYQKADFESPEIRDNKPIVVNDESSQPVEEGKRIMSSESIEFLFGVSGGIADKTSVHIKDVFSTPSPVSGDFSAETEEGWMIHMNQAVGIEKTAETLRLVLENNIKPEDRSKLEYIDLRSEGKAYYRYKQDRGKEIDSERGEDS